MEVISHCVIQVRTKWPFCKDFCQFHCRVSFLSGRKVFLPHEGEKPGSKYFWVIPSPLPLSLPSSLYHSPFPPQISSWILLIIWVVQLCLLSYRTSRPSPPLSRYPFPPPSITLPSLHRSVRGSCSSSGSSPPLSRYPSPPPLSLSLLSADQFVDPAHHLGRPALPPLLSHLPSLPLPSPAIPPLLPLSLSLPSTDQFVDPAHHLGRPALPSLLSHLPSLPSPLPLSLPSSLYHSPFPPQISSWILLIIWVVPSPLPLSLPSPSITLPSLRRSVRGSCSSSGSSSSASSPIAPPVPPLPLPSPAIPPLPLYHSPFPPQISSWILLIIWVVQLCLLSYRTSRPSPSPLPLSLPSPSITLPSLHRSVRGSCSSSGSSSSASSPIAPPVPPPPLSRYPFPPPLSLSLPSTDQFVDPAHHLGRPALPPLLSHLPSLPLPSPAIPSLPLYHSPFPPQISSWILLIIWVVQLCLLSYRTSRPSPSPLPLSLPSPSITLPSLHRSVRGSCSSSGSSSSAFSPISPPVPPLPSPAIPPLLPLSLSLPSTDQFVDPAHHLGRPALPSLLSHLPSLPSPPLSRYPSPPPLSLSLLSADQFVDPAHHLGRPALPSLLSHLPSLPLPSPAIPPLLPLSLSLPSTDQFVDPAHHLGRPALPSLLSHLPSLPLPSPAIPSLPLYHSPFSPQISSWILLIIWVVQLCLLSYLTSRPSPPLSRYPSPPPLSLSLPSTDQFVDPAHHLGRPALPSLLSHLPSLPSPLPLSLPSPSITLPSLHRSVRGSCSSSGSSSSASSPIAPPVPPPPLSRYPSPPPSITLPSLHRSVRGSCSSSGSSSSAFSPIAPPVPPLPSPLPLSLPSPSITLPSLRRSVRGSCSSSGSSSSAFSPIAPPVPPPPLSRYPFPPPLSLSLPSTDQFVDPAHHLGRPALPPLLSHLPSLPLPSPAIPSLPLYHSPFSPQISSWILLIIWVVQLCLLSYRTSRPSPPLSRYPFPPPLSLSLPSTDQFVDPAHHLGRPALPSLLSHLPSLPSPLPLSLPSPSITLPSLRRSVRGSCSSSGSSSSASSPIAPPVPPPPLSRYPFPPPLSLSLPSTDQFVDPAHHLGRPALPSLLSHLPSLPLPSPAIPPLLPLSLSLPSTDQFVDPAHHLGRPALPSLLSHLPSLPSPLPLSLPSPSITLPSLHRSVRGSCSSSGSSSSAFSPIAPPVPPLPSPAIPPLPLYHSPFPPQISSWILLIIWVVQLCLLSYRTCTCCSCEIADEKRKVDRSAQIAQRRSRMATPIGTPGGRHTPVGIGLPGQQQRAGYGPPGAGYGPPGAGYGPPGAGYGPPGVGYGPPGAGYGPPGAGYGQPGQQGQQAYG